ncbi:MAG: hypothetical protein LBJ92_03825 [Holosporales bacterium]|nr:hypothetical protein [Holosporales bacterium]
MKKILIAAGIEVIVMIPLADAARFGAGLPSYFQNLSHSSSPSRMSDSAYASLVKEATDRNYSKSHWPVLDTPASTSRVDFLSFRQIPLVMSPPVDPDIVALVNTVKYWYPRIHSQEELTNFYNLPASVLLKLCSNREQEMVIITLSAIFKKEAIPRYERPRSFDWLPDFLNPLSEDCKVGAALQLYSKLHISIVKKVYTCCQLLRGEYSFFDAAALKGFPGLVAQDIIMMMARNTPEFIRDQDKWSSFIQSRKIEITMRLIAKIANNEPVSNALPSNFLSISIRYAPFFAPDVQSDTELKRITLVELIDILPSLYQEAVLKSAEIEEHT